MKLLKSLKNKPFCNNIHFILISIALLMLSMRYPIFFILFGLYLIYLLRYKLIFITSLVFLMLVISRISMIKIIRCLFEIKDTYIAYCIDIKDDNSYYAYIGINKILIYDYNHNIKPGDILNVSIKINDNSKSYENDFDYESHLLSKGISFSAKLIKKEYVKNTFSIYSPKYYYIKYLKNNLSEESFDYINSIVLGNNILDNELKESYSFLGISHILAISGLHIILLFKIISFILLKLFHIYRPLVPISIISIYIFFIGFPASALRALLFLIFTSINKGNNKYTKLDILSLSFILMIIFRPFYIYQSGFILSFLVSFILIFKNEIIKESNSKLLDSYKTYLIIFLITLPIIVNFNNKISIISLLISPVISIFTAFILIPLSYIDFLLPIFDYGIRYIFIFINLYVNNLSKYLLLINMKSLNIYLMSIYYLLLSYIIVRKIKKKSLILPVSLISFYMILIMNFDYINPLSKITFIDVGQGDSMVIRLPYNEGIMVIDAYNSFNYLKTLGLNKIDYLVLTHSDSDHIGDYQKIINYFNVKNVLYPKYDTRFNELLDDNTNNYGIDDNIIINSKFNIKILGPINEYDDTNSISIVLKLKIYDKTYLFTGDMTEKEEIDLVNKYNDELKCDVLKVAHHGSISSTSELFLSYAKPSISIISVSKDNNYGHPSDIVLNRLKAYSNIYLTYLSGNIDIYSFNSKLWVNTYK